MCRPHDLLNVANDLFLLLVGLLEPHQDLCLGKLKLSGHSFFLLYVSGLLAYLPLLLSVVVIKLLLLALLYPLGALLRLLLHLQPFQLIRLSEGFLEHDFPTSEDFTLFLDKSRIFQTFLHNLGEPIMHNPTVFFLSLEKDRSLVEVIIWGQWAVGKGQSTL